VDQGGKLDRVEDLLHGVTHRKDEAGGELAQFAAGVHQGRGVGEELHVGHDAVETVGKLFQVGLLVEGRIGRGDGIGYAAEKVGRSLQRLAVGIPFQVAFLQYGDCVG